MEHWLSTASGKVPIATCQNCGIEVESPHDWPWDCGSEPDDEPNPNDSSGAYILGSLNGSYNL